MSAAEEGSRDPPKAKGKVKEERDGAGAHRCPAWGLQGLEGVLRSWAGQGLPVGQEGHTSLKASSP